MRRVRSFDGDVQIVQDVLQILAGVRFLFCRLRARTLVDIMLKRYLREMDVIGGDERGVVDIDGVVDDGLLLLAREHADDKIDHK